MQVARFTKRVDRHTPILFLDGNKLVNGRKRHILVNTLVLDRRMDRILQQFLSAPCAGEPNAHGGLA
jgi:hypothetical protein